MSTKTVSLSEFFSTSVSVPVPVLVGVSAVVLSLLIAKNSKPSESIKISETEQPKSAKSVSTKSAEAADSKPRQAESSLVSSGTYRFDEESGKETSVEYTKRGSLWIRRASWHFADCPRAKKQYSLESAPLEQIISTLKKYDVDPNTGFLPSQDPLQRLPYARYHIWEDLADDLPKLLAARLGQSRGPLRALPVISTDLLQTNAELRRAHLVLCMLAHAYVWGGEEPLDVLPAGIAVPLWEVSQRLGLPAVLSHTDVVLYNWRRLDPAGEICMSNLATLNNFFNGRDESWFYLITAEIEAKGASSIVPMLLAMDAINRYRITQQQTSSPQLQLTRGDVDNDDEEDISIADVPLVGTLSSIRVIQYVTKQLVTVAQAIDEMTISLMNTREGCLPYIFYHRVRPFLSGWKNNPTMPHGLLYEGVSTERFGFYGGSAAQSALLPFLDITLGISHAHTKSNEFLLAMRDYMLSSHRAFLASLNDLANVRDFVMEQIQLLQQHEQHQQQQQQQHHQTAVSQELIIAWKALQKSYDLCVTNLTTFRTGHISIVAEYVMAQQKQQQGGGSAAVATGSSNGSSPTSGKRGIEQSAGGKGTGGTDLMTFLKPIRDDCQDRVTAPVVSNTQQS